MQKVNTSTGRPSLSVRVISTVLRIDSTASPCDELQEQIGRRLQHVGQHELLARCLILSLQTTYMMNTMKKFTRGYLQVVSEQRFIVDLNVDIYKLLGDLEGQLATGDVQELRMSLDPLTLARCTYSARVRLIRQALFSLRAWVDVSIAVLADSLDLRVILDCQSELDQYLKEGLSAMRIQVTAPLRLTAVVQGDIEQYEGDRLCVSNSDYLKRYRVGG